MWTLLKKTVTQWLGDDAPRLGASLAYYTIFSIAPLLLIVITIAGVAFGNAESQILEQVEGLVGSGGREMIASMVEAARKPTTSVVATTLGIITLIFGACGVFVQLKNAFNLIWRVDPSKEKGVWSYVRKYIISFSMVLGLGFLFLVSMIFSTALSVVNAWLGGVFPGWEAVMRAVNFLISFVTVSFIFALLFKFLPDTHVGWKDVAISATWTALLFTVGKFALTYYFAKAKVASAYGAAGSLVLILLWVYYSAQILFFGAELSQVYAQTHGSRKNQSTLPSATR